MAGEVAVNCLDEHSTESEISLIKTSQKDTMKTKILNVKTVSLDKTNKENSPVKSSLVITDKSTECLSENNVASDSVTLNLDSNVSPTASKTTLPETLKITFRKLFKDLNKQIIEIDELLELINMEMEDSEELLDMVSNAKEKLEFFFSHVEYLIESLKENSKDMAVNNLRSNTYVKKIYRKKLEEFAFNLLIKIKKSTKALEVECDILKEQKKRLTETCKMISEFIQISNNAEKKKGTSLLETVGQLLEEIYSMKSKQLAEIKEVSYIETDVEMLYDLYRRFSSIEGLNLMSTFNFMQRSC